MAKQRVWTTKDFWLDTGERVASTAIQAALGVLVATGIASIATGAGLAVIGTAAAASLLKALLAALVSSNVSPASLVPEQVSDQPVANEVVPEEGH